MTEGSSGRTSVQLDALLGVLKDFSGVRARKGRPAHQDFQRSVSKLTIGAAISLSSPTPIAPLRRAETTASGRRCG